MQSDLKADSRQIHSKTNAIESTRPDQQHFGSIKINDSPMQIPMRMIINEVMKYLIEIIETLMQQQNDKHYIEFMKKSMDINREMEQNLLYLITGKFQKIQEEIDRRCVGFQKIKKLNGVNEKYKSSKSKEKEIVKQIIGLRSNSLIDIHIEQISSASKYRSQKYLPQIPEIDIIPEISSLQINSCQVNISELQEDKIKYLLDLIEKIDKRNEQNSNAIQKIIQQYNSLKLWVEEQIDSRFDSIWNVIADHQSKISQIEANIQMNYK